MPLMRFAETSTRPSRRERALAKDVASMRRGTTTKLFASYSPTFSKAEGEGFEPSIRPTTDNGFETVSNVPICRDSCARAPVFAPASRVARQPDRHGRRPWADGSSSGARGDHLRQVAWQLGSTRVWITNTLRDELTNAEMLALVGSCRPLF